MEIRDFEAFKKRDASSYDSRTEQFDHFTERLTSPLAARMVGLAEIKPSDTVLDVGTGTGVVALQLTKMLGTEGRIHAIDLSEEMLATARGKAKRQGHLIEFSQMDAEELKFDGAKFDVVMSLFALLHFPDPSKALNEIHRVLRPGGRLVLAVGSSPSRLSVSWIAHGLKRLPDLFQRFLGKQLVAPGFLDSLVLQHLSEDNEPEESHMASHSRDRTQSVTGLINSVGFEVLHTTWQGHQTRIKTPEEFWEIQRTFSSISRKRLAAATPEHVASIKRDFFERCETVQSRGGNLIYPFAAFYVVAQKPK